MLAEDDAMEPAPQATAKAGRGSGSARNSLVRNAFAILQAFRGSDDWLTSRELSLRANLPRSSGHRLIHTLEELGAVVRGPHGRYRPGMLLVSLSHTVGIAELLREAASRVMHELSERLQLTVHLGVLEDGMVTYVNKVSTQAAFPPYTQVGSKLEAYCSGLGKVLLAALPPDRLENFILEGDLVALTPHTITDRAQLVAELETVRARGYAIDDCEYQTDMRCIAVPVHDGEGQVVAALSVTGLVGVMTMIRCGLISRELIVAAALVSQRLAPRAG